MNKSKNNEQTKPNDSLHSSVGFPGNMGGEPMPLEKNLEILEANGFNVERTDKGILVDKHPKE